jgi:Dicarboxylate transport
MLLAVLVLLVAGGAVAAWEKRTDLVAWAVAAYLKGDDVQEVSLDVIAVERDRLAIRNLRVVGAQRITVDALNVDYTFSGFIRGTVDSLAVTGLRVEGGAVPTSIDMIKGDGRFSLTPFAVDRLAVGLDLLRLRVGDQRFDPSRIEASYHDRTLVLESAFTAPDGYVTVLGSGPLDTPNTPFHLLLSGRLNAALAVLPAADVVDARGYADFSISAQFNDPLFFLSDKKKDTLPLPEAYTVDGTVRLALKRLKVLETEIPTAASDKVHVRIESAPGAKGSPAGIFDIKAELDKRDAPEIGFAKAEAHLTGRYSLDGDTLAFAIADGPLLKLSEMRLYQALPMPGDIALQLLGGGNKVAIDLKKRTASHAVNSQLLWKNGELSLRSEGHLTDPDDPTVFTLRGAFDATPLLALSPKTKSATGNAHLFLAGRVSQPLLLYQAPRQPEQTWPGEIRLDGAVKLDTTGLTIPGAAASPKAKDSLEIILKSFNGSDTQPGGRLAINGVLDARRFGSVTVDEAKLALEGRLSYGTRGYQFLPGIDSVLNIKSITSTAGFAVPDGLNFQLTGADNQVTVPADLSGVYHVLTFAHIEAAGYVESAGKKHRPFLITLPTIASRHLENGKLTVYITGGTVELPDDKVIGRGVNAALEEVAEGYDIRLETSEIRHEARPPMTTPLTLAGKGEIRGDRLTATLNVRQLDSPLKATATVRHNLATQAGQIDFTVPKMTFGAKKATLDDISPLASNWVTRLSGTAAASGHLLWDKDILSGQMTVDVDGLDLSTQAVRLSDVKGTVNFIELVPPSMPPRQRLTGMIATSELGPWPVQVEFQLMENGTVEVQDLDIAVAGGVLRTRATVDMSPHGAWVGSAQIRSVDLRELFELFGIDGLNGSGRITGTVPIRIQDGKVAIADGLLKAEGPGVLRYQGTALQEQISARGDTVGTVAQVLSDFHYVKLSMALDKPPEGEGVLMLRMEGANPKVLEGHPFAFNIKIESDFQKLARIALGGLKSVTDVLQQGGADRPAQ